MVSYCTHNERQSPCMADKDTIPLSSPAALGISSPPASPLFTLYQPPRPPGCSSNKGFWTCPLSWALFPQMCGLFPHLLGDSANISLLNEVTYDHSTCGCNPCPPHILFPFLLYILCFYHYVTVWVSFLYQYFWSFVCFLYVHGYLFL